MIVGRRGARPRQRVVKPGTIDLVGHDGTSVSLTDPPRDTEGWLLRPA